MGDVAKQSDPSTQPLTVGAVFWFWLPLAAMWLMMGIEHPAIPAVIARLPGAERNLAAFGLSFSLALIIESPIIMLLTAATALARDRQAYGLLLRFTHIMAVALTALHLLTALTPLYRLIVGRFIGAPLELIEPGRRSFLVMTPWTAAIAYRRLWQGILIRYRRTKIIPITMLSRLVTSLVVLVLGYRASLAGNILGALALSLGVMAAAVTAFAFCRPTLRHSLPEAVKEPLAWRRLLNFYIPLALTTFINMVGRPILAFGLARAPQPLASLAVWPVIMGTLFIVRSLAIAHQEAVVALLRDWRNLRVVRHFTWLLAGFLSGGLLLVACSPIIRWWFEKVAGLSLKLVAFTTVPVMILAIVPGLDALLSWLRGLQICTNRTRVITQAVGIDLLVLILVIFVGGAVLPVSGAIVAAMALSCALAADCLYLRWRAPVGSAALLDN